MKLTTKFVDGSSFEKNIFYNREKVSKISNKEMFKPYRKQYYEFKI